MSIWRLVIREIVYRRLTFLLALLAIATAVGSMIASVTILQLHDLETERLLAELEAQVKRQAAELKDDMRRATLKLSFNLLILPKDQKLRDWYTDDYATKTMPESHVDRLASSGIVTVRHFLPSLQERI